MADAKASDVTTTGGGVVTEALPETTVAGSKGKAAKITGNVIFDVANEVETLSKTKVLHLADKLAEDVELSYLRLGGLLKKIKEQSWFDGYADFGTFVFEKYGFQDRKATYLISIYENLVDNQIPWDKVQHLGWTKLKDLAPILTLDNLDDWVAKASVLTVAELQAAIKAAAKGEGDADVSTKTTDDIKVLKFKCHADQVGVITQALAKAKGELHTEHDPVALENICSAYIGNAIGLPTAGYDLDEIIREMGINAIIDRVDKAFNEVFTITVSSPGDQDAQAVPDSGQMVQEEAVA